MDPAEYPWARRVECAIIDTKSFLKSDEDVYTSAESFDCTRLAADLVRLREQPCAAVSITGGPTIEAKQRLVLLHGPHVLCREGEWAALDGLFDLTLDLTLCDHDVTSSRDYEDDVRQLLHEYRIHAAEVLFREDCTIDQFIDLIEGNRKYVRCLYIYNKIDMTSIEECRRIAAMPDTMVLSPKAELNTDIFRDMLWEYLGLVRVYTKPRGKKPDFDDPLILTEGRHGVTIESVPNAYTVAMAMVLRVGRGAPG